MPCLNEAETLETCIVQAKAFLKNNDIEGEVVIADNGSTDGSQDIALRNGARVVNVPERGYGAALRAGIADARGQFVAMGDADDSYDFGTLGPFIDSLRQGNELVMGNRFAGGIDPGAMPWLHKYIGNPVLSFIGRLFFRVPIRDFHCGLRAFRKKSILGLNLRTTGMEFASEMVVKASLWNLKIDEQPTTLRKDGRSRPPHLRSFHDGWRHLRFLLLHSPRWLFLYPGLVLLLIGGVMTGLLINGPVALFGLGLDVGSMLYTAAIAVLGVQLILFAVLAKIYAVAEGFLPTSPRFEQINSRISFESGIVLGVVILLAGIIASIASLLRWRDSDWGSLEPTQTVRTVIPAVLGLIVGGQVLLAGLFSSFLRIRKQ